MNNTRNNPEITDWADMVEFTPNNFYQPKNLDDLKDAIKDALKKGTTIRVPASKHSCSDIFEDVSIINMELYPKTIKFSDDNKIVTASANWVFANFLTECSKVGKSIRATGGVTAQFLAGLISTDTAPATSKCTIYQDLQWVEYLIYDSKNDTFEVKNIDNTDSSFQAIVCSVGAMGVLLNVRFGLIDELFFRTIQKIENVTDVLKDLEKTSRVYDFWRIDWVPKTDKGLLWAANEIPKNQADPDGDYPPDFTEKILLWVLKCLGGYLLNPITSLFYKLLIAFYKPIKATGPLRNMLPVDNGTPLRVAMAEWSFNPAEVDKIRELCKTYYKNNGWPNLPIEIELAKTDNYYLSPWNWEGLDYIIKFNFMYLTNGLSDKDKKGIVKHLEGLWNYLIEEKINFKAHWGKINFMDRTFVKDNFDYDKFSPFIKEEFLNKYLLERFTI